MHRSERDDRRREWLHEQEMEAAWHRARNAPRPLYEQPFIPGIGFRRLQVVYEPSLRAGHAWDILEQEHGLVAFSSSLITDFEGRPAFENMRLVGYDHLDVPAEELRSYVERLARVSIPIWLPPLEHGGHDGETCEIGLFGDLFSALRLRWWSEPPQGWEALVEITNELIERLREAAQSSNASIE
jgi:hypothetical protein